MSQSKDILRNTKREMIMLPRFSIDERTAYLKYTVSLQHWLSAVGLEHEVSNTETMEKLISKLLWGQVEKWSKYFEEQEEEVKARPFEPFLRWLAMAGRLWETVLPLMQKIKEGMNPLLVVSCSG